MRPGLKEAWEDGSQSFLSGSGLGCKEKGGWAVSRKEEIWDMGK